MSNSLTSVSLLILGEFIVMARSFTLSGALLQSFVASVNPLGYSTTALEVIFLSRSNETVEIAAGELGRLR